MLLNIFTLYTRELNAHTCLYQPCMQINVVSDFKTRIKL